MKSVESPAVSMHDAPHHVFVDITK